MTKRKPHIIKIVHKSCLNGRAVWVSHERTYLAEWKAYKKACRQEINRIKSWGRTICRRKSNIMGMLGELTASLPIVGTISQKKKDSARVLKLLAETPPDCYRDFYHHILEEQRSKPQNRTFFQKLRKTKITHIMINKQKHHG